MAGSRSALIVATDAYQDPKLHMLRAPTTDAEALAGVLSDPDIGDFDVTFSVNAKEHELRRTLSTFFADRSPEDVLLLHFGCHGLKDEDGRLYFAAADTEFAHLEATAVPAGFVNRRMNDSRSKRIILFLDCCYSGAFASGMTARADETVEIKERFEGSGRVVLTASNAMEYSFEGDNRHGSGHESVFTSALVRGLRSGEADLDQDHWISVDELYDYVFERVREQTPHQTPGKWSFVQGDVYVARSSYVVPVERLDLPRDLQSMETSALASTREQLVAELQTLISTRPQFADSARQTLLRLRDDDSRLVSTAAKAALATGAGSASAPKLSILDPKLSVQAVGERPIRIGQSPSAIANPDGESPRTQARPAEFPVGPMGSRADFWTRFAASLLDGLIIAAASLPFAFVGTGLYYLVLLLGGAVYSIVMEGGPKGQTVGKMALGIRVIDRAGGGPIGYTRGFIRWIGHIVSTISLMLGYLWMLWDKEKQTWHDKMAGAIVVPTRARGSAG